MDARAWLIMSIVGYSFAGVLFVVTCVLFFKMKILAIIGDISGRTAAKQIQEIREQNILSGNKRHIPSAFNLDRGTLTEPVKARTGKWGLTGTGQTQASKGLKERGQTEKGLTRWSKRLKETGQMGTESTMGSQSLNLQGQSALGQDPEVHAPIDEYSDPTEVLASNETELLAEGTEVLAEPSEYIGAETEVLVEGSGVLGEGTEVLSEDTEVLGGETEVLTEGMKVLERGTEVLTDPYGTTVLQPVGQLANEEADEPSVDFKIVKDIKVIHTDEVI